MTQYNGIFENALKLQKAYNTPIPTISESKKEKWMLVRKFPPVTPRHDTTNDSFEDNEKFLKELEPFLEDVLLHTIKSTQIECQQEQSGPRLIKKLTPTRNTGNK